MCSLARQSFCQQDPKWSVTGMLSGTGPTLQRASPAQPPTVSLADAIADFILHSAAITGFAEGAQVGGEVGQRGQGVGVVVAEHAALAGQGVFIQLAGRLELAQLPQILGEVAG